MQEQNQNRNDEIDLIEVFTKFQKWFKVLVIKGATLMVDVIGFLYRKKWQLFLFLLLGIAVSIGNYKMTERYYSSECVIKNNAFDNPELANYLNRFNDYLIMKDYTKISEVIDLDTNQLKSMKQIRVLYQIDKNNDGIADFTDYEEKDTSLFKFRLKNKLVIQIIASRGINLSSVEDKINNYIFNNTLFVKQNELRVQQKEELIAMYNAELDKLDKLQDKEYFEENKENGANNQLLLLNEKEPQLYYKNKIEIKEKIQKAEKELALYSEPVTVIQNFSPWLQPENNLMYFIQLWVPLILLMGLVHLVLYNNRKRIFKRLSMNQVTLRKAS